MSVLVISAIKKAVAEHYVDDKEFKIGILCGQNLTIIALVPKPATIADMGFIERRARELLEPHYVDLGIVHFL